MTRLLLIRHAENEWVKSGRLAGWTPDVHLNEEGKRQADALGQRLATAKLRAVYSSPLERCVETAAEIVAHYPGLSIQLERDLGEIDYGAWTGKRLRQLARSRLWRVVQTQPSRVRFPDGESFQEAQSRLLRVVYQIADQHRRGMVAIVSHADVIKLGLAHFCGMHIDLFQRLIIAPASISVVELHRHGIGIGGMNDTSHYYSAARDEAPPPAKA